MLIESELFGRERGAYTGAITRMAGRFELADRSTLSWMKSASYRSTSAKLLRVLEGVIRAVGVDKSLKVDVRVIAATNRDLAQEVAEEDFAATFLSFQRLPNLDPAASGADEDIPPLVWRSEAI